MKNVRRFRRRGNIVVLTVLLLPILAGLGAFAIDVGYIEYSRTRLQAGADAAALAAVEELPSDQATLSAIASSYATLNAQSGSNLNVTLEAGRWDKDTTVFTHDPGFYRHLAIWTHVMCDWLKDHHGSMSFRQPPERLHYRLCPAYVIAGCLDVYSELR